MTPLVAIWIVTGALATSSVFALSWAVRNDQFDDAHEAARSIFEVGELDGSESEPRDD